jgi:hypothetical protein
MSLVIVLVLLVINALEVVCNLESQGIIFYLSMALEPFLGLGRFFSVLIVYTVSMTPWTGDQPFTRPLPEYRSAQTQNKRTQTSMPQVEFEPTILVSERAKQFMP